MVGFLVSRKCEMCHHKSIFTNHRLKHNKTNDALNLLCFVGCLLPTLLSCSMMSLRKENINVQLLLENWKDI
jgi:hypothetical protein